MVTRTSLLPSPVLRSKLLIGMGMFVGERTEIAILGDLPPLQFFLVMGTSISPWKSLSTEPR